MVPYSIGCNLKLHSRLSCTKLLPLIFSRRVVDQQGPTTIPDLHLRDDFNPTGTPCCGFILLPFFPKHVPQHISRGPVSLLGLKMVVKIGRVNSDPEIASFCRCFECVSMSSTAHTAVVRGKIKEDPLCLNMWTILVGMMFCPVNYSIHSIQLRLSRSTDRSRRKQIDDYSSPTYTATPLRFVAIDFPSVIDSRSFPKTLALRLFLPESFAFADAVCTVI